MIVRSATGDDGPAISDLMIRAAPHFDTKGYPDRLLPPGMVVLVAEEAGRVVGWLEAVLDWAYTGPGAPAPPPHGYVLAVVVDPAWRRRGIGCALLDRYVREARENGVRWVFLLPEGGEGTQGRLAFFRAAGFTPLPATGDPLPPMGRWTCPERDPRRPSPRRRPPT
ncbi:MULTISPECIES: GNAT family N-acetyltransferase [unclassified Nocardiopsis]|uniref:GNAT family N-acetyltransferase n=1 Tax=unclassified Nocardiopsis TaxID=2649073 RepID=UPI0033D4D187